ncbi:hypothetical protein KR018_005451, partial [Drosophila ironensis]
FNETFGLSPEICHQPPVYGKCKGRRQMWYFNPVKEICKKFIFSNCGGNFNRFSNSEKCKEFCIT